MTQFENMLHSFFAVKKNGSHTKNDRAISHGKRGNGPVCYKNLNISALPLKGYKNKKSGDTIEIKNLKLPPDSERRETFEALILLKGALNGVPP